MIFKVSAEFIYKFCRHFKIWLYEEKWSCHFNFVKYPSCNFFLIKLLIKIILFTNMGNIVTSTRGSDCLYDYRFVNNNNWQLHIPTLQESDVFGSLTLYAITNDSPKTNASHKTAQVIRVSRLSFRVKSLVKCVETCDDVF